MKNKSKNVADSNSLTFDALEECNDGATEYIIVFEDQVTNNGLHAYWGRRGDYDPEWTDNFHLAIRFTDYTKAKRTMDGLSKPEGYPGPRLELAYIKEVWETF